MKGAGDRLTAASSWLLVAGLVAAPLTLGHLDEQRDLWAHVALCTIVALAAAGTSLGGGLRPHFRWRDLTLAALLLVFALSATNTVYRRATLAELMHLVDYLALYLLVRVLLRRRAMFLAGAAALGAGAAISGALGLREYLVTAVSGDPSWRAFGPFYNPNLLAAALLMGIPLWIALVRLARLPALRLLCGLALLLCWLCLFVTGSKGGLLALMGGLLVGAVLAPDPAKGALGRRALIGVILVVLAAAAALLLPPIRLRLAAAFGPQSNSMMFRYYTWLGTWHMVLARPALGFGPGTFAAAYPRFAIVGHTMLAHETYLQVAAETGILGGLCLLAALGAQLVSGFQAARRLSGEYRTLSAAATAGMVGFCLHNAVDYGWHVTAIGMAFWGLAGLVSAALDEAMAPPTDGKQPAADERRRPPGPIQRPRNAIALAIGTAAVALAAAVPALLAIRAEALVRVGDLRAAVRLDPLNDLYRRQLAMVAQEAAGLSRPWLYQQALSEWSKVEGLRPTYPGTYYNRGRIYEAMGDPTDALREYGKAVDAAPTWTDASVAQARLLDDLEQHEHAMEIYRHLDALSRSPLFEYRAVIDDLDPNFARAWLAIGDDLPATDARGWYIRAATYLREVFAANRRMEGAWRVGGEWQQRQGEDLVDLAEEVARRHVSFEEPGPRLRAALLLVDAERLPLAQRLFIEPEKPVEGETFFGALLEGWAGYVSACHLRAKAAVQESAEERERLGKAASRLVEAAGQRIGMALGHQELVDALLAGPYGFSPAEMAGLKAVVHEAEKLEASEDDST